MIRALIRYYINLFIVCSKVEDGVNIDLAIKSFPSGIFLNMLVILEPMYKNSL